MFPVSGFVFTKIDIPLGGDILLPKTDNYDDSDYENILQAEVLSLFLSGGALRQHISLCASVCSSHPSLDGKNPDKKN